MTRHYIGNHDTRCSSCGGWVKKATETGLNRIQCKNCSAWITEYVNPTRKPAD